MSNCKSAVQHKQNDTCPKQIPIKPCRSYYVKQKLKAYIARQLRTEYITKADQLFTSNPYSVSQKHSTAQAQTARSQCKIYSLDCKLKHMHGPKSHSLLFFCDRHLHLCVQVVRMTQREYTNCIFFTGIFVSTHKASLFKTRATLSDSAVRWDRAAAKQFMDRQ